MYQIRSLILMYHTYVNCPVNFRINIKSILIKVLNKLTLQYYLLIWLLSRISEMIFPMVEQDNQARTICFVKSD